MSDLFESSDLASDAPRPLADRLRPKSLAEVVGQDHLLSQQGPLVRMVGQGTLLFIDEIHRFNRSQQDSFLPVVEDGTVVLVGATTENPSFELNGALLSRTQVLVLRRLDDAALETLLARAEDHYGEKLKLTDDA